MLRVALSSLVPAASICDTEAVRHSGSPVMTSIRHTVQMLSYVLAVGALFAISSLFVSVSAQQVIKISQLAWVGLLPPERDLIQKSHIVSIVPQDSFGLIIDNQGVNESTNGTSGGAALGGAIANAAYVDNAIRGGNYSAVNQLAVGILGAIVGSTLDSKAKAQYHYRYAVKFSSGNIQYFDEVSSEAFRHPAGVCVSVPNIALIDQQLCSQTPDSLRIAYLRQTPQQFNPPQPPPPPPPPTGTLATVGPLAVQPDSKEQPKLINCKLGTLAPVQTTPEKCESIRGSQVQ